MNRFCPPTASDELSTCFGCNMRVAATDSSGQCSNCHGNNIGVLCSDCGDEWATHIVKRKALCDECDP